MEAEKGQSRNKIEIAKKISNPNFKSLKIFQILKNISNPNFKSQKIFQILKNNSNPEKYFKSRKIFEIAISIYKSWFQYLIAISNPSLKSWFKFAILVYNLHELYQLSQVTWRTKSHALVEVIFQEVNLLNLEQMSFGIFALVF